MEQTLPTVFTRSRVGAALACLILYIPLIGLRIPASGYNPDELRFAAGLATRFADVHGRWATHIGHNIIFGGEFFDVAHAGLTFFTLFAIALLLVDRVFSDEHPLARVAATVTLFVAGGTHVYLTEILHYQSLVFWFTLGLLCSVIALVAIEPAPMPRSWGSTMFRVLLAAELLSISIGFYQSYALLGFVLPAVAVIRADRFLTLQAGTYLLRSLLAAILALALYKIQLNATIWILGLEPDFRFSGPVTADVIREKLSRLPAILRLVYGGGLQGTPHPFRGVYLLLALSAAAVPLVAVMALVLSDGQRKLWNAVRVLVGSYGALIVLPVAIWFLYPEPYLIGRSIGFLGFLMASITLANCSLIAGISSRPFVRKFWTRTAGLGLVAVMALNSAVASSNYWQIFRETSARDAELAGLVAKAAGTLHGFDVATTEIRTVGGAVYPDLAYGGFNGISTFHRGVDVNSVFQVLYGAANPAGSLPFSPRPCPPFPEPGATFMANDTLFVCLEASDGPPQFDSCIPLGSVAFCTNERVAVLAARTCSDNELETGDIFVTLLDSQSNRKETLRFVHQVRATEVNDICVRALEFSGAPYDGVIAERVAPSPELRWKYESFLSDTVPLAKALGR